MEHQICSPLSVHKTIVKPKHKIRIIHIFAPAIIKTDTESFKELVQRLTGKPSDEEQSNSFKKSQGKARAARKKMEVAAAMLERVKGGEEEEIWRGAEMGGGFLGEFADHLDGFMQEANTFSGLEGSNSIFSCCSQMQDYGEMQFY